MQANHQRALVIVNRRGTRGSQPIDGALAVLAGAGITGSLTYVRSPRRIAGMIRDAVGRFDIIIIGGGDGTLSAAADALIGTGLVLGILPMGNANDLARTLGIPFALIAAARVIAAGRTRPIDLGRVNGRHFFNVASVGLSVDIADRLTGEDKRRWGVLAYLRCSWEAVRAAKGFHADVICDGTGEAIEAIQIAVGNGRHYGGGMTIVDDATIDDGRLDLYALPPHPWWRLMALAPVLRRGTHRPLTAVHSRHGAEIRIETKRPLPVNVDGEVITKTPAAFDVVPAALRVFAPDQAPGLQPIMNG